MNFLPIVIDKIFYVGLICSCLGFSFGVFIICELKSQLNFIVGALSLLVIVSFIDHFAMKIGGINEYWIEKKY